MTLRDQKSQRLFVEVPLSAGVAVPLSPQQVHYLVNVLRLKDGAGVLLFDGEHGEWRGVLHQSARRSAFVEVIEQTRAQSSGPDIDYLFAPLKHARLDYMVQKATEMGVGRLRPVLTERTLAERVNLDRMRANVIEAAEQCGVLRVPEVMAPQKLMTVLSSWESGRTLIFCDEMAPVRDPVAALAHLKPGPVAVLLGPEGGFTAQEAERLRSMPSVCAISLGPRIMRADTAAVAALALVNATLGDWR